MKRVGLMMDKRGLSGFRGFILGVVALFVLLVIIYFVGRSTESSYKAGVAKGSTPIAAVAGVPEKLNFLNYIFGEVPNVLIENTGNQTAAIIVYIAILALFLITFTDIVVNFGTFSGAVNWAVGILFAIISVNLKIVFSAAVWFFTLVGGLAVVSVGVGILVPFVLFFIFNFLVIKNAGRLFKVGGMKKDEIKKIYGDINEARAGLATVRALGKDIKNDKEDLTG